MIEKLLKAALIAVGLCFLIMMYILMS